MHTSSQFSHYSASSNQDSSLTSCLYPGLFDRSRLIAHCEREVRFSAPSSVWARSPQVDHFSTPVARTRFLVTVFSDGCYHLSAEISVPRRLQPP
ncbi:hypothetical protein PC128_g1831 [Phytophthora cactorum]|nr:hypothetical protein PC121_g3054 [Phytophthora cactorum]KAG3204603.1 hypothetical protein PC128_g1831 [Phytophthora cactorum]KAG4062671.1 hypothetical protein PC123_g2464 [Phytophthora cactorum]